MAKNAKNDRRSKRTRQLIGSALVELMLEKPFDDITVQDILDRADVGRSTFYAHYTDKEQLLMSEIERVMHQMDEYTSEGDNLHHGLLPGLEFFRHVQEQHRLMRAFVWGRAAEMLTRDFEVMVSRLIGKKLHLLMGDRMTVSVPLSVAANFMAGTFLMLLRWWFEEDMRHTPEQMNDLFQMLVMSGIHGLVE